MTLKELEHRLRGMVETKLGGRFRGPVHPLEVARALVAEMILSSVHDQIAPNVFFIHLHPGEELSFVALGDDLDQHLFGYLAAEAQSRDLRFAGPVHFEFAPDPTIPSGHIEVIAEIDGPQAPPTQSWRDTTLQTPILIGMSGFAQGLTYTVRVPRSVVGRDESCDVRIGDPRVSSRHAVISWHQDSFWLEDLQSKAGTFCNQQAVYGPIPLRAGDVLSLGFSTLRFEQP